jgi:hypothetical protein
MRILFSAIAATVVAVATLAIGQQAPAPRPQQVDFVIERAKPFVLIEFVKIGQRQSVRKDEPALGVWLRLVNNCRVPIQLTTFQGMDRSENVMHAVVYDEYKGPVVTMPDGTRSPPEQEPRSEMPYGYSFDVGMSYLVQPGKAFEFSVPVNHVSADWHVEVPFEFALPEWHCCQPKMNALFMLHDVPEKARSAFQKQSR